MLTVIGISFAGSRRQSLRRGSAQLHVVEACLRIGLGPQSDAASRTERAIAGLDDGLAVEKAAQGVAAHFEAELLPLPGRDARRPIPQRAAPIVEVLVKIDIVLEGVRPQDVVVAAVLDARDQSGGLI